jgi:hypothetical protein
MELKILAPQLSQGGSISRSAERILLWFIISLLVLSNVLTVSNSTFQQSLYDLLSHVPVAGLLKNSLVANKNVLELDNRNLRQQYQQLNSKWESHRTKANTVAKGVIKRSAKNAAKNVSSIIGEAIPYLGTALIVSVTADDVIDACNTIRDMNEMAAFLETETNIVQQNTVCGTKVPTADEIMASVKQGIGTSISQAQEQTKESARGFYEALGGTLYQIFSK